MSTATAIRPETHVTKTPAQAAYSGERRSTAAKWGWTMRRDISTSPSAETIARNQLEAVIADTDPDVARLYACRVAESVVQHFTDRYPGDAGCTKAIAAARRFARGEMSEWGRRRASTAVRKVAGRAGRDAGCYRRTFRSASQAASWCLDHNVHRGVIWSLIWAADTVVTVSDAATYEQRCAMEIGILERYCAELEALQATK